MIRKLLIVSLITTISIAAMSENSKTILAAQTIQNNTFIPLSELDTNDLTLAFAPESVNTRNIKENINLFFDTNGFFIKAGENVSKVASYNVDPILRNRTLEEIAGYGVNNQFRVTKIGDEYSVAPTLGLNGGGVIGAAIGGFLGKSAVSVVGHGTIAIIAWGSNIVVPGSGVVVGMSLESNFGAAIEAASLKGAIAGGILGGTATGPV